MGLSLIREHVGINNVSCGFHHEGRKGTYLFQLGQLKDWQRQPRPQAGDRRWSLEEACLALCEGHRYYGLKEYVKMRYTTTLALIYY